MNADTLQTYTRTYFLTAGECNAEGVMPLTLLTARIIEVATEHANALGIGYADLIKSNLVWVLSRVSIEIDRMPHINATYTLRTWIEGTNRMLSERCFDIIDDNGNTIAKARTTWAAIDIESRRPANLAVLGDILFPTCPMPQSITPAKRIGNLPDSAESETYTFRYCDLDFNRHVNTVRYIDLILNHWTLAWHDRFEIRRFDITFHHECHYDETVTLRVATDGDNVSSCELLRGDTRTVGASLAWREKNI